ncbi:porin [Noviherbaspirillum malthae]|jgi:predicted porin|uniref:porin n=1 Tax=Noviherbaspirillum malthae TaxID=1260987 RepID=UPI00188DF925|nr:porin [Noviherbaspirillum malthae]
MKKNLLALALFAAFANIASAQTNVSIYGVADVGFSRIDTNTTEPVWGIGSGQQSGSRIGFRGTEDLGGGLSAIFTLENGYNIDTGSLGQGGRLFGRQAFVGLSGKALGTLKMGRQYTLNHDALNVFDPFSTNLAGNTENAIPGSARLGFPGLPYFWAGSVVALGSATPASGLVVGSSPNVDIRLDNSIVYQTGNFGGFTGALQYGLGEQAGSFSNGRQLAVSATYANGPIAAVATYTNARNATGAIDQKSYLLGGTYNLGVAKLHAGYQDNQLETGAVTLFENRTFLLGATVPVGVGNVLASWIRADDKNSDAKSDQIALGYSHPLSKRTNLYTSAAWQRSEATGAADVKATIFNAGIRHLF